LEEGPAAPLLPTDRLAPRPVDVGVRRSAGRALIAHRTLRIVVSVFLPSRLQELASPLRELGWRAHDHCHHCLDLIAANARRLQARMLAVNLFLSSPIRLYRLSRSRRTRHRMPLEAHTVSRCCWIAAVDARADDLAAQRLALDIELMQDVAQRTALACCSSPISRRRNSSIVIAAFLHARYVSPPSRSAPSPGTTPRCR